MHLATFAVLIIILLLIILAFEIWMFVDVIINKNISDRNKIWWVIGMLLVHPFVAIAYYLTDRKKR